MPLKLGKTKKEKKENARPKYTSDRENFLGVCRIPGLTSSEGGQEEGNNMFAVGPLFCEKETVLIQPRAPSPTLSRPHTGPLSCLLDDWHQDLLTHLSPLHSEALVDKNL